MDPQDSRAFTNPRPWRERLAAEGLPEGLFEALDEALYSAALTITFLYWLDGGNSGSIVAAALCQPDGKVVSGAVVKLIRKKPGEQELRGLELAQRLTLEQFREAHLVKVYRQSPLGVPDWHYSIQQMAHFDLSQARPLSAFSDDPRFGEFCGQIIEAIVTGWSTTETPKHLFTTPARFLRDSPAGKAQGLAAFAEVEKLDRSRPSAFVEFPGRQESLVNPFALMAGEIGDQEITIFCGPCHGDLHADNVMIPVRPEVNAAAFRLYDYGRFSSSMPVSRDPAKLVLEVAREWIRHGKSDHERSRLADIVVVPEDCDETLTFKGHLDTSRRIFKAAEVWGRNHNAGQQWRQQHLLVLAESALRYVAREDIELKDRRWYFETAALALTRLLPELRPEDAKATHDVVAPQRPLPELGRPMKAWWYRPQLRYVMAAGLVLLAVVTTLVLLSSRSPDHEGFDVVYTHRPLNGDYETTIKTFDGKTYAVHTAGPVTKVVPVRSGWAIVHQSSDDGPSDPQQDVPTRVVLLSRQDGTQRELIDTRMRTQPQFNLAGNRMLISDGDKGWYRVFSLPGGAPVGTTYFDSYFAEGFVGEAVIMRWYESAPTRLHAWMPEKGLLERGAGVATFDGFIGALPGGRALFSRSDCLVEAKPLEAMRSLRSACKLGDLRLDATSTVLSPDGRWLVGTSKVATPEMPGRFIVADVDSLLENAAGSAELPLLRELGQPAFRGGDTAIFNNGGGFVICTLTKRSCQNKDLPLHNGHKPSFVIDGAPRFEPAGAPIVATEPTVMASSVVPAPSVVPSPGACVSAPPNTCRLISAATDDAIDLDSPGKAGEADLLLTLPSTLQPLGATLISMPTTAVSPADPEACASASDWTPEPRPVEPGWQVCLKTGEGSVAVVVHLRPPAGARHEVFLVSVKGPVPSAR